MAKDELFKIGGTKMLHLRSGFKWIKKKNK